MDESIMAELKITQKIKNGHYHIIYLRDDNTGITSFAKGHSHDVYNIPTEVDPEILSWNIMEENGHTHEIIDYPVNIKDKEEPLKDKIENFLTDYTEAMEWERESRKMGQEADDMFCHKQWAEKDASDLESKSRAALTINRLEEKIDNLSGYQRQNRTEPKFLPTEEGDSIVADILGIVNKNILEQCVYQREKTKVFEDMCIPGRGLFNHYMDYETNIQGKVVIERYQWDEAYFLPHSKEDLSDCDGLIKEKWFSEAKLKEMYPDEMKSVSPMDQIQTGFPTQSEDWDQRLNTLTLIDKNAKKYCLLERVKKEYKRVFILANPEDGSVFNMDGWTTADIKAAESIGKFNKIPRTTYRMRYTKYVVDTILEDYYTDDIYFPLVPAYAKFRNGMFWGKIQSVKDLQLLINKTYSQFIDIIAKMADYGYYYDENTFDNPKDLSDWKKNASSPGFTAKVADVNNIPVKVEGVKFPTEIINAISMFNMDLRQMMNINIEMAGTGNEQTGIVLRQKIVQQLLGNDFIFDNLSFAEQLLSKIIVRQYIAKYYTPQRMIRILGNANAREEGGINLGGQPYEKYPQSEIERILTDADLTQYDVIVGESSAAPSAMMAAYLMVIEAAKSGVPIPSDVFVQLSPMPADLKKKIMESIIAAQQAEAEQNKLKYGTELEKARIAQEGKMMDKNPAQLQTPSYGGSSA